MYIHKLIDRFTTIARILHAYTYTQVSSYKPIASAVNSQLHALVKSIMSGFSVSGGVDYVGVSGTFSFDSANTVRCVSVGIVDDTIPEDTECFYFRLNAVGPDVVVTQDPTPIRILDNDSKC